MQLLSPVQAPREKPAPTLKLALAEEQVEAGRVAHHHSCASTGTHTHSVFPTHAPTRTQAHAHTVKAAYEIVSREHAPADPLVRL